MRPYSTHPYVSRKLAICMPRLDGENIAHLVCHRSELIEMLAKLGLPNDGRTVDEMMRAADVDGDGVIR